MLGMLGGAARKQKAQEAEGRHPWFQHGLLVDPRLVGRWRQEAREEKKNYVASWLAQECYRVHSEEAKRLLRKDLEKKLAELFEKLAPPWEWRQSDTSKYLNYFGGKWITQRMPTF